MSALRVLAVGFSLWLVNYFVQVLLHADFWWQWPRAHTAAILLSFAYLLLALLGWGIYAYRSAKRSKGLASLANGVLAGLAGLTLLAGFGMISDLAADEWGTLTGRIQPAQVAFDASSGRIALKGAIERGTALRFAEVLKASHGVRMVALDSPGGLIDEAARIGRMIGDRNLDTLIERSCMSACVDIFISGVGRLMAESAIVGLHSASSLTGNDERVAKHNDAAVERMYRVGVERRFAQSGADTPAERIAISSAQQAYAAGLATGVIAATPSLSSK